jgi:hypothetical protein
MEGLGMYVFIPSFIFEVDTTPDCHLSYTPLGRNASISSLDYIQPVIPRHTASTTTTVPSVSPAVIEDDDNDNDNANNDILLEILPTYASLWPKKPPTALTPLINHSPLPFPSYETGLKDLDCDELIRRLFSLETQHQQSPADTVKHDAPLKLECMSEQEDIVRELHHPGSRLPPVRPCDTPNSSETKTTYTPEELHRLTECRWFRNYQHIIASSKGGTLLHTGKFPLSLGMYATIPKAP